MEEFENGHKREEEIYIEEPNEYTNELAVENEMEPVSVEGNGVPVFEVAETEDKIVAAASDGNPGASEDVGTDENLISSEIVPRSTISSSVDNSKGYVQNDNNTPADKENRDTSQPPVSANPSLVPRTSWTDCCGLFQVLRRSSD